MEEKLVEQKCDICKEKATKICFDCSYYLCDDCFEFIHKKDANSEHKKEEINPFSPFDIRCPEHPKFSMSLFCKEEKSNLYIYLNFNNYI